MKFRITDDVYQAKVIPPLVKITITDWRGYDILKITLMRCCPSEIAQRAEAAGVEKSGSG